MNTITAINQQFITKQMYPVWFGLSQNEHIDNDNGDIINIPFNYHVLGHVVSQMHNHITKRG